MFGLFKKTPTGETVTFKIDGMHCTSCSMNIDGALEDTEGVLRAETSYAKAITNVIFDTKKVSEDKLKAVIESLEYTVTKLG